MSLFQIIILITIGVVILKSFLRFRKKEISILLFSIWLLLWLAIALIGIFPITISYIANFVGVGRGVDLIIYIALFVIFYTLFKFNIRLNKNEYKISAMIRKSAENNVKKGNNQNG